MAKILVADDNSNVQKTVALALADLGVEVVAVNNGDAAVRKLGDVNPDLVLADIFMPVRNGYEVCDYVKKDSRFSHVPVVLLVGAFDPLDEREAQRVAADGILKKPFVPPDPLIAMVKALLERVGAERLVGVGAAKPAAAAESKSGGVAVAQKQPAPQAAPEPPPEMELQAPVERVSFGEGERPIAFGELLEPAVVNAVPPVEPEVIEPITDDQVLTSSRDSVLGEPAFWKDDEPEIEAEEGSAESEEADSDDDFSTRAWTPDLDSLPSHAEDDAVHPVEPFELVRDESASAAPTVVELSPIVAKDAASQAALTVDAGKAPDLAANPLDWMASAPPVHAEETPEMEVPWTAAPIEQSETAGVEHSEQEEQLNAVEEEPASDPSTWAIPPASVSNTIAPPAPPTWPKPPATISSLPSTTTAPPAATPAPPPFKPAASTPEPSKTQPSLNQKAEDTARAIPKQDWADLAAILQTKAPEPVAQKPQSTPVPAAPVFAAPPTPSVAALEASAAGNISSTQEHALGSSEPDPALVEAVVQRVLDKMRPQVVDIITKEFLRPVVQALVSREIQKR